MKLTGKTLIKLTKGAVYYTEERGYFTPFRYSQAQIEYMADEKYDWGWRMRARFTGGIRLEFKTDATLDIARELRVALKRALRST